MKSLRTTIVLGALLLATTALAETNTSPIVVSVDFYAVQSAADLQEIAKTLPCLQDLRKLNGTF